MGAAYTQTIVKALDGEKFKNILEPACGDGQNLLAIQIEHPKATYDGFDIEGEKWGYPNGDIRERWLYEDKSYDVVLIAATLLLFDYETTAKIIEEAKRVAKKIILIMEVHDVDAGEGIDIGQGSVVRIKRDYTLFFPKTRLPIEQYHLTGWSSKDFVGSVLKIYL